MKKRLVFSLLLFFPIPLIVLLGIFNFHFTISVLYTLTATVIMAETVAGIKTRSSYTEKYLPVTAVIVAYLPNEHEVIFDTIAHFQKLDFARIVVAYNTPQPMAAEADLEALIGVTVIKVPGSTSKADNLNFLLDTDAIETEYLAIFDADHEPEAGSVIKASNWLSEGYDAVQGRCIVRNRDSSFTQVIGAEFDTVYRLLHNSRFNLSGTAIFGGSNCYWRLDALGQFRFKKVLTEDIEVSLRALASGVRIAHDPNIISTEEAPETLAALWKQRVRWSQGWLEVTVNHSRRVLFSKHLSLWARFYWFYNLIYREMFSLLSFSIVFVLLSYLFFEAGQDSPVFLWTTIFTIGSIFVCSAISKATCDHGQYKYAFALNMLATFPFTLLKSIITTMAWTRHITKDQKWETTARSSRKCLN